MKCECCGYETNLKVVDGNATYNVCHNCVVNLINLSLSPEQFKTLIKSGHTTDEFLLHDDFYDENGEALQPR